MQSRERQFDSSMTRH
nr:unnamed protein product [Callosobruchus chinensis]